MDVRVSEVKCLMCGQISGYALAGRQLPGGAALIVNRGGPWRQRCSRCGGRLFLDPSYLRPRELGIDESRLFPREEREEQDRLEAERQCVSCGSPVQRAERCRRCYLRHRYATNPAVRAKQLALQAAWRRRRAAAAS